MSVRKSKKIGNIYGNFKLIDTFHKNKDTIWIVQCLKCGKLQEKSRHSIENCTTECKFCGNPRIQRNICGHYKERIYNIYVTMIQRTTNKNHQSYNNYGGRGIQVCKDWLFNFMNFYEWSMQNGYDDLKTIDRIDNNKGYSPDNCRWVDCETQCNNRRNNLILEFNGQKKTAAQWAKECGIDRHLLYNRLRAGWEIERALKEPVDTSKWSERKRNEQS